MKLTPESESPVDTLIALFDRCIHKKQTKKKNLASITDCIMECNGLLRINIKVLIVISLLCLFKYAMTMDQCRAIFQFSRSECTNMYKFEAEVFGRSSYEYTFCSMFYY